MTARVLTIIIGFWLFVAIDLWPHTAAHSTNTWITGALIAMVGAAAVGRDPIRYVTSLLAVWLVLFTVLVPRASSATLWNNVTFAIAVFALSLMPNRAPKAQEEAPPRPRPAGGV